LKHLISHPQDIGYRLPWSVGLICTFYLWIANGLFFRHVGSKVISWEPAHPYEFYVAASILAYATVLCVIFWIVRGVRKRDWPGFVLLLLLIANLYFFSDNFLHKIKGYVIWPMCHRLAIQTLIIVGR
jgi:hypothetical protein